MQSPFSPFPTPTPELLSHLRAKLLSAGGNEVELSSDPDPFLTERLLNEGRFYPPADASVLGVGQMPHKQTLALITSTRGQRAWPATGFALRRGVWQRHSWMVSRQSPLIETLDEGWPPHVSLRQLYFGIELQDDIEQSEFASWVLKSDGR